VTQTDISNDWQGYRALWRDLGTTEQTFCRGRNGGLNKRICTWPAFCMCRIEGIIQVKSVAWGVMTLAISLASLSAGDAKEADKTTACENLVKYMQEARKIVREFKNPKRAERLLELKRNYAEELRHTPDNARRAAAQWIAALNRADHKIKSGTMEDSAVFDVLRFRNRALRACGIKAEEAGF
jgi:hypothetical protein